MEVVMPRESGASSNHWRMRLLDHPLSRMMTIVGAGPALA
jgi:hypothetical protein